MKTLICKSVKGAVISSVFVALMTLQWACSSNEPQDTTQPDAQPDGQPDTQPDAQVYFPPIAAQTWERTGLSSLGWDEAELPALIDFLNQSNTRSFMVLVNGRIVVEEYFNGHTETDTWQWNSAGKTLVTASTNIAKAQGLLDIDSPVSDYLGVGWTSAPADKENLITIRNLLSMTSGLDDEPQRVIKRNLTYLADAGSRWAYGNVFQKIMDTVAASSGMTYSDFFNNELASRIGMTGFWNEGFIYTIYHSDTRSMARFGHLALNKGRWNDQQILDTNFFNQSTSVSQAFNLSYGYLWWLNSGSSHMKPGSQTVFDSKLIPDAPDDLIAALGANEQRIYVVPSQNMVVVRMGEQASNESSFALSAFDNALWQYLNAVIR